MTDRIISNLTTSLLRLAAFAFVASGPNVDSKEDQRGREAKERQIAGTPYYQFYDQEHFASTAVGRFVANSPNNALFYGNNRFLFAYDGVSWHKFYESKSSFEKVISLFWDNDRIYAGGYNSIGELVLDEEQRPVYRPINQSSLSNNRSDHYDTILKAGDTLVFKGDRTVVLYNTKTEEIEPHAFDTWTGSVFNHDGEIFVASIHEGIFRYQAGKFIEDERFAHFVGQRSITDAATHPNGTLILSTQFNGLYQFDGESVEKAYPNFTFSDGATISDIEILGSGNLAVALGKRGLIIIDNEGEEIEAIDNSLDHRFSSIRKIHEDEFGVLWALFNDSVAKILLNTPLTSINEHYRPPLDYAQPFQHENDIFLVNNRTLLGPKYSERGKLTGFFPIQATSDLSVSTAAESDEGLYIQANNEIYLYSNNSLSKKIENIGYDRMIALKQNPGFLVGANGTSFTLLQKQGDGLSIVSQIQQTEGFANKLAEDSHGNIWIEYGFGILGKITIKSKQLSYQVYAADDGLPPDWLSIWEHSGQVLFSERTGIYAYDSSTDRFIPSSILDPYFPREKQLVHRAASDPAGNIWITLGDQSYILWKLPHGKYHVDSNSLSQLGELVLSNHLFLEDQHAFLITPQQFFHYDLEKGKKNSISEPPLTKIASISTLGGDRSFYFNLGSEEDPDPIDFDYKTNNLEIRFSNTFSDTTNPAKFQYRLEGFSEMWSNWSTNGSVLFTNLSPRNYSLKVRTHLGNGSTAPELVYNFQVKPPFYQTTWAYVGYTILSLVIVLSISGTYTRRMKIQHLKLEKKVLERTREIEIKSKELKEQAEALENKNAELAEQGEIMQNNTQELASALAQLHNTQDQLLHTARKAGMAEVATNVLHNVGNVLNSINIGIISLASKLHNGRIQNLDKISDLIQANKDRLPEFLSADPKGKAIPDYLKQLAFVVMEELKGILTEIDGIKTNIDHVKKIIATQQAHAKTVEVIQPINLEELIESAIAIVLGNTEISSFHITKEFEVGLIVESDKHKVLQMLTNFVKNAHEAILEAKTDPGLIHITGKFDPMKHAAEIRITDNGIGINPRNLDSIFSHGFTTKDDGHGFGLHSCANNVKALGGELRMESRGEGHGATIIMKLPKSAPMGLEDETVLKQSVVV